MPARAQPIVVALAAAAIVAGCMNSSTPEDSASTGAAGVSTQWFPAPSGKYLVQGAILQKYIAAGTSNSALGSPIANEQPGPEGGRYSKFEGGEIYWTPQTGARIVSGAIRNAWEYDYGGAAGALGYPVSDQQSIPGGFEQRFQRGKITFVNGHPELQILP